jgi:hypothetical protein
VNWMQAYRELPFKVLGTLSDGEETLIAALKSCWPDAPHQRCQEHILSNLAEPVLQVDARLRQRMRDDLGGLPPVPTEAEPLGTLVSDGPTAASSQSEPSAMPVSDGRPTLDPPLCSPHQVNATRS